MFKEDKKGKESQNIKKKRNQKNWSQPTQSKSTLWMNPVFKLNWFKYCWAEVNSNDQKKGPKWTKILMIHLIIIKLPNTAPLYEKYVKKNFCSVSFKVM